jgi:hypothetical protein
VANFKQYKDYRDFLGLSASILLNLPVGTTGQRPTGADISVGSIRFNSSIGVVEWYNGSAWIQPGVYTDENAQDAVGNILSSEFTYDDATPLISVNTIAASKITGTKTAAFISDFSTAADARITLQKGAINGLATLDATGVIPNSQVPPLAITNTFVVASQAAMLAVTAQTGDVAVRTDINKSFILAGSDPTILGNWQELLTPTDSVTSVNGQVGVVSLTTTNITEGTNLYYSDERVDDRVAALIQNGTNITWTYNDAANTLTANVTGSGLSGLLTNNIAYSTSTTTIGPTGSTATNGLWWNNSNNRLGINQTTPGFNLDITGNLRATAAIQSDASLSAGTSLFQSTVYQQGTGSSPDFFFRNTWSNVGNLLFQGGNAGSPTTFMKMVGSNNTIEVSSLGASGNALVYAAGTSGVLTRSTIDPANVQTVPTVATGLTAAGATQGTAFALSGTYSIQEVTTVAAGTGVKLPDAIAASRVTVINRGANDLLVYPFGGDDINVQATNIPYTIPIGGAVTFIAKNATSWYTERAYRGGDVAGSDTSTALTIASHAVTNAKMAQMAAHTYKGNNTGSTADAIDVTNTQLTADLNVFTSSLQGLVPASGGGTSNFLRADGTWTTTPSGFSNPMTTLGDIIYEDGTPAAARLAGNTTATKKFLVQTGTGTISAAPLWDIIAAADIPSGSGNYIQNQTASAQTGGLYVSGLIKTDGNINVGSTLSINSQASFSLGGSPYAQFSNGWSNNGGWKFFGGAGGTLLFQMDADKSFTVLGVALASDGNKMIYADANGKLIRSTLDPANIATTFTDGSGFDFTFASNAVSLKTTLANKSIPYIGSSAQLAEDNANFQWDTATKRLEIITGDTYVHGAVTQPTAGLSRYYGWNDVTYTNLTTMSSGAAIAPVIARQDYTINSAYPFQANTVHTAALNWFRLLSASSQTSTVEQGTNSTNGTAKRAISANAALVALPDLGAGIATSVNHVAAIQVYAPQPDTSGSAAAKVTMVNYYGLLLGNSNEYSNIASQITNPWGIWQDGANDKNVFFGKSYFGQATSTPSHTAQVDVNAATGYNQLRLRTSYTPSSSSDSNGNVGDLAWDTGFIYVKTAAGAWKRAALSTF